jgi:hypothetical protein
MMQASERLLDARWIQAKLFTIGGLEAMAKAFQIASSSSAGHIAS